MWMYIIYVLSKFSFFISCLVRLLFSLGRATAGILGCGSSNCIKLPEKSTQQEKHTMDFQQNEVHTNLDQFWPVTHPIEPLEEDQPVKCPMPHTCVVKDNEEKEEQFFSETLRRKAKLLEVTEHKEMVVGRDHPPRAVRRRHHIRSNRKNTAESSNAPLYPFPSSKDMIFTKLGHLY
ncbi:uncharacterized protein LOC113774318 [Coffea eugenioides]|uniref:uncharacterized protein LOC113774318 n=1 Tax=Coffea eugenioides TaxID=49369 RepID=UPI000F612ED5|nr:uncharacterized protein LOC113774318 [Coffea eugenioides]